jgi:hypothetical protein
MTLSRNFTVRVGNSGTTGNAAGIQVRLRAGDPPEPIDLTGDSFVFRVYARGQEALRRETGDGIAVDLVDALVTVVLSQEDSRTLADVGPALVYDLERRPAGGGERTVLFGSILIEPGVNDDA